ncbi:MAG TPA: phosphopantetheine-binding protein [Candidatus Dormibacteraeota bacterium]
MESEIDRLKVVARERIDRCARVREVLVERLQLPIDPDWLTDDQPLFGRGIELDSVDALEIALALDAEFGVAISDEDPSIFGSVARLALFIEEEWAATDLRPVQPSHERETIAQ